MSDGFSVVAESATDVWPPRTLWERRDPGSMLYSSMQSLISMGSRVPGVLSNDEVQSHELEHTYSRTRRDPT